MHALCSNTKIVKETMHKGKYKYHELDCLCYEIACGITHGTTHEIRGRVVRIRAGDRVVFLGKTLSQSLFSPELLKLYTIYIALIAGVLPGG